MTEPNFSTASVRRPDGLGIRCFIESPDDASADTPVVILIPAYGSSIRDLFAASLTLTLNGFRTWRFDYANHVGASDGGMDKITLTSACTDVHYVAAEARRQNPTARIGAVSFSLGSRVAIRAVGFGNGEIGCLVSLVGVVNVQDTLHRATGYDVVREYLENSPWSENRQAFGYAVHRNSVRDVIDENWRCLDSARDDISRCKIPVINVSAERDEWVDLTEAEQLFQTAASGQPREFHVLPRASHKLVNNPTASRAALTRTVQVLKKYLQLNGTETAVDMTVPSFVALANRIKREREWEKRGYDLRCVNGNGACQQ